MKYQDKKFSVPVGGKAFAEGWERAFGKAPRRKPTAPKRLPRKKPEPKEDP